MLFLQRQPQQNFQFITFLKLYPGVSKNLYNSTSQKKMVNTTNIPFGETTPGK